MLWEVEGVPFIDKDKGTRLHKIWHYDSEGDLDEATVSAEDMVYVESRRLAVRDLGLEIIHAEYPVGNEPYGYATKVDAFAYWQKKPAVVNWKSAVKVYAFEAVQSALEAMCWADPVQRLYIHLRGDKPDYRVELLEDRKDFVVAKAACTIAAWKRGLKNGNVGNQ